MKTYEMFHDVLVNLFNEIMDIEEKAIITPEFSDITNNDMHVIEAIGLNEPKNMSAVAKRLNITVGTLTIAINNLVKKGYVNRVRSQSDKRVVLISLSDKGVEAYQHHKEFHERMIHATIDGLTEEETAIFVRTLENMRDFFRSYKTDK